MKLKDKLKRTSRNSKISILVALLSVLYFCMITIKGIHYFSDGSSNNLALKIHYGTTWIIQNTYFPPLDYLWNKIPSIPFEGKNILAFYKVIIPPAVVFLICSFFINDHRSLKTKFHELKAEVEKEIALKDLRRDAGINTVPENATVDVVISNATNSDPSWHDTWWGRIAIGLAIVLVATALGLK